MRARVQADLRVSSTTDDRIDGLLLRGRREALRSAYRLPTGFQRAPFFEVQTDRFALVEQYATSRGHSTMYCSTSANRSVWISKNGARWNPVRTPYSVRRRPASSMRCSIRASVVLVTRRSASTLARMLARAASG